MIKDIAFVCCPVTDMKKSRAFYEGLLGLVPSEEFGVNDQWIEYNVGNSTITLGCSDQWKPSKDGPSAALEVDDLAALVAKLKDSGVSFKIEIQDFPGCSMAAAYDPDGNVLAFHHKKS